MTKAQKTLSTIILIAIVLLGSYFYYKTLNRIEILSAKQDDKYNSINFKLSLFSDSTYQFIESFPRNPDTITSIKGRYYITKDTLYFKDEITALKSSKGVLKNNTVDLISKEYYNRLIITQSSLDIKSFINFKKHPDFAVFTFDKKFSHNHLSGTPYDLVEKDILDIIQIFDECPTEHGALKSSKYWKQCIAVINSKGEKEVWLNCSCSLHHHFQYGIFSVMDGGPCYMRMKINLTTHSCYDVNFNGY